MYYINKDEEAEWSPLTREEKVDDECFDSACLGIDSWMLLPKKIRNSVKGSALLDASYGLLQTKLFKNKLTSYGASNSIKWDDEEALRCFIALGATFEKATVDSNEKDNQEYIAAWESSVLHKCAKIGSYKCLNELVEQGYAEKYILLCEGLLEEPIISPLRQITPEFLKSKDLKDLKDIKSLNPMDVEGHQINESVVDEMDLGDLGNSLIMALLNYSSAQTENISVDVAVANVCLSNPLFIMLNKIQKSNYREEGEWREIVLKLVDAGFFNAQKKSHCYSLVSLASSGSELVSEIALKYNLSTENAGHKIQNSFYDLLLKKGGLNNLNGFAKKFCMPMVEKENFSQNLYKWVSQFFFDGLEKESSRLDQWEFIRNLDRFSKVRTLISDESKSGFKPINEEILINLEKESLEKLNNFLIGNPPLEKEFKSKLTRFVEDLSLKCIPKKGQPLRI